MIHIVVFLIAQQLASASATSQIDKRCPNWKVSHGRHLSLFNGGWPSRFYGYSVGSLSLFDTYIGLLI